MDRLAPGDTVDVRVEVLEVRRRPARPVTILVRSLVPVLPAAVVGTTFLVAPEDVVGVIRRGGQGALTGS